MQTFLPYESFTESAKCLDMKRLGKQRVETLQLLNALNDRKGWYRHPCAKMWEGHTFSLAEYGLAICAEWCNRGYKDTCFNKIIPWFLFPKDEMVKPKWLGNAEFHASHRSNLLRKFPEHYSKFGWTEPDNLPYVWPKPLDV